MHASQDRGTGAVAGGITLTAVFVMAVSAAACLRTGGVSTPPLIAGTPDDSAALARAIGLDLRSGSVRGVVNRFLCPVQDATCVKFPGSSYRWGPSEEPFLTTLAAAAAVPVRTPKPLPIRCPESPVDSFGVGYHVTLNRPQIEGDLATVTVTFDCSVERRGTMWGYERDVRYQLRRQKSSWQVVAKQQTRIT